MKRIRVLPEHISLKIAAGEVIERPVSVVKELVENSIDAMATSIEIEIRDGGKEYIRVSDNGSGIHPEDLKLAFLPHATSKIRSVDDLFAITSLGFRGEALASVSSVSSLVLRSRTANTAKGYQISFAENQQAIIEPVGMDVGTTVEVRRLFYNTPARYKFLKQSATEKRYIVEFISNMAVAHPQIAFRLIADDKLAVRTHGQGEFKDALANLVNRSIISNLVNIDYQAEWGTIKGYLSKPNLTRKNRQGQLIILNGRIIESALIASAVEKAYTGMLEHRQYPVFYLFLAMDPQIIDVNVHPAKIQVRFQDENALYQEISAACRQALVSSDLSVQFTTRTKTTAPEHDSPQQRVLDLQQYFPVQPLTWSKVDQLLLKERRLPSKTMEQQDQSALAEAFQGTHVSDMVSGSVQAQDFFQNAERQKVLEDDGSGNVYRIKDQLLNGRIIGQFRQTYILLETETGLWLLDQHIVHERILYERLLTSEPQYHIQQILPLTLNFSRKDSQTVVEYLPKLRSLGLELEEFGTDSFILRGVPSFLAAQNTPVDETFILELVDDLSDQNNWREKAVTTLACKSAIKAGHRLETKQIHALLEQLAATENPFTCPHGRPIIVRIAEQEILRRFGR
ncbi:MAG TPA: DNA mismatch repair endonuclease MutL [Firmicutes bacterium]|nr:DNA mismatch repair endonuclease MutL [Bacillota bacterium]